MFVAAVVPWPDPVPGTGGRPVSFGSWSYEARSLRTPGLWYHCVVPGYDSRGRPNLEGVRVCFPYWPVARGFVAPKGAE